MKAIWNNVVIAESDDTVVVEGNHYFPIGSINDEFFKPSDSSSVCQWKGTASYYTIKVGDKENIDAAWYYLNPSEEAMEIENRIAFWKGVEVVE
ncbi:DUF427 domain-containing protein [Winogradskyella ursingii]|uniref:DUF427 domain-containing protein n=1 Tax=Winogradskyella ursingii TaxID=2686079 RepID=UPI0015C7C3D7|nr:DUF427 domain-containing protein [Winogradskyella ursingii]